MNVAITISRIQNSEKQTLPEPRGRPRDCRIYEELINGPRTAFLSAPGLEGMLEGGVPVMVLGQCVGAVGVSGVKSSDDLQIAPAGITALAL